MKRSWYLILSFVLTAIVGYVLYRSVPNWGQAVSIMVSGKPQWFLAGLGFILLHMVLRAVRWGVLLGPTKRKISLRNLLSLTLVKYAVNLIPPRVGEFVGSILLARKEKIPATSTIAASLFERVLDFLSVMVLFGFYMAFFARQHAPASEGGREIFNTIRISTIAGFCVTIFVMAAMMLVLRSRRWHDRVPGIVRKYLLAFLDGFRAMESRRAVIRTLLLSLLIWLTISGQLYCMIRAYLEVFPVAGVLLILAVTVVGVAIPTPGGVGGFQFFMNMSLVHFFARYLPGTDPASEAAGISNGAYIFSMIPVILVGLVLLHREGLSFGSAVRLPDNVGNKVM